MIEVKLLGPPRVEIEGVLASFDTRKAVALLAYLALADRPLPRDAVAELLWPEHDVEHARGALRRTLSTLRAAVGGESVQATRDHISLAKGNGLQIDVRRFRALCGVGDLEQAVALFRGDFLEGFGLRDAPEFEDWARAEADALRRELATALAQLAADREQAGDHLSALGHVRRWLSLDPLHEPAHRALIRLYALTGDRASALVQYRECVRTLSRELGVPPLPETTQLYEAINDGSFDVAAPPVPPSPEEPVRPPAALVGRDEDLRALRAAYDGIAGRGRLALVEGEAGIGKTRLGDELLADVRRAGAAVLAGRAYEDEAALAYAPVVDALRARLRENTGWVGDVQPHALAEAVRLVPELADARPGIPHPPPSDAPGAETRFLAGVWETLAAAVSGKVPGVLCLDDAQWLDDATTALLAYGVRRLDGLDLLVVLTWRTPTDHPLHPVVAQAAATAGTVRRLERLSLAAVGELVANNLPDADSSVTRRLYDETEGVPLLLVEYVDALRTSAAEPWSFPASVNDLLRVRLDHVSAPGRQILATAAVIGRSFDFDTVRMVSGRTDEETVGALEELVRRGLVREGAADYDFSHEKLRAVVYDDTSLARRRLLHGRVADVPGMPAASLARHLQLAGRESEAALSHARAANEARDVFANAEAAEHLRTALALGHPDPGAVHAAIGDLQTLSGAYAEAIRSYETAAAHCRDDELAGIEHRLGQVRHRRGEWALAEAHFIAALHAAPNAPPEEHARITVDLSLTVHESGDTMRARELARQAFERAQRSGDRRALGQAHNLLGMLATADGDIEQAVIHLRSGRDLAERVGDVTGQIAALNNLALAHRSRGDLGSALELTREALDLCTRQGDRHREAALHNNLADLHHALGQPERAMEHLKQAVAIFAEIGAEDGPRPEVWKLVRW